MTAYPFVTLDVFTDQRFGGNPLAVFPDAAGMDAGTMQGKRCSATLALAG